MMFATMLARTTLVIISLVAGLERCATAWSYELHAAPTLRRGPDLSGRWTFDVDLGSRQVTGEFWIWRRGDDYTGTLTVRGTNTLPVRSLSMSGAALHMTVDSPEGPVVFAGDFDERAGDARGFVTYHAGERYPMVARRVRPGSAPPPSDRSRHDRLQSLPSLGSLRARRPVDPRGLRGIDRPLDVDTGAVAPILAVDAWAQRGRGFSDGAAHVGIRERCVVHEARIDPLLDEEASAPRGRATARGASVVRGVMLRL